MLKPAPAPEPKVLHFAIVVEHPKLYMHLREHCFLLAPEEPGFKVQGHIIWKDPDHPLTDTDWYFRKALVESGLATPDQVAFTMPVPMEPGYKERP